MKVLHVIPSVSPVRGGPSQAILQMVYELRSQGVEADILTTNDDGDHLLDVPLKQWIDYPVTVDGETTKTVPIYFCPRFSPPVHVVREFAFSSHLAIWLWNTIAQYDVIHVHAIFSYASTVAMAIARMQGVPYIVRPLGQLGHWALQQSSTKKQLYLNLIERSNLQNAAAIHYTTEQERQEAFTLALKASSIVIPHGILPQITIPDAAFKLQELLNLPAQNPVILFLSRLHPKKGLHTLIPALKQLKQPFTFVIAGNGSEDYEREVDRLLSAHQLHHITHRLGFVSGELKQLLLQGSDLFVLPSYSENFGIAVLEALNAGLPVLITPEVALSDVVQQHRLGWIVPQETDAIAAAINQLLTHPHMVREMGDRARQVVQQQYSWKAIAHQLIECYSSVCHPQLPALA